MSTSEKLVEIKIKSSFGPAFAGRQASAIGLPTHKPKKYSLPESKKKKNNGFPKITFSPDHKLCIYNVQRRRPNVHSGKTADHFRI